MAWVKLDDAHQDHPKVAGLSDRAYRLWVRAICYSNRFGRDGVLTAAELRRIRGPIGAKKALESSIIETGLWHRTDDGIRIHDISDYQPNTRTTAELSKKRSEAGRRGAAARWDKDGKLPLAKNAPVPSRPVPSRPEIDRESDYAGAEERSKPNGKIELRHLEQLGFTRFGQLGGSMVARLARLTPIAKWEWDAVLKTQGKSWGYAASVLESIRNESAKPAQPPAGAAPETELQRKKRRARELRAEKQKRRAELDAKYAGK